MSTTLIKRTTIFFVLLIEGILAQNVANTRNDSGVPPGFEKVLPPKQTKQLRDLHANEKLTIMEKRAEFERIMSTVPSEILAKLPIGPAFERLPEEWQAKIRDIHANTSISLSEKQQNVNELINFPPRPPPGFEKILTPETYSSLLKIHQDPNLNPKEKAARIDEVMRSLPQDTMDKLPLPPGFDQLPEDKVKEAKAIFSDRTLDYQAKDRKVADFVMSLPPNVRRSLRPPLPPVLNQLPPEMKEKIETIFDDENTTDEQRQTKFWQLVNTLPTDEKIRIQDALHFA